MAEHLKEAPPTHQSERITGRESSLLRHLHTVDVTKLQQSSEELYRLFWILYRLHWHWHCDSD
eukprot:11057831-Prorocentrum_lima.AAC.1